MPLHAAASGKVLPAWAYADVTGTMLAVAAEISSRLGYDGASE
jgi:hypothetical protein